MAVELIVAPSMEFVKLQRVAIATVETRWATFRPGWRPQDGVAVGDIPFEHRQLAAQLYEAGKRFVERMSVRGLEFIDSDNLHVYGPSQSYNLGEQLQDINEFNVAPDEARGLVKKADPMITDVCDYRLVGNFIMREQRFDEPVHMDPNRPGARRRESRSWLSPR